MEIDDRCFDCLISRVALECGLCKADDSLTSATVRSCAELALFTPDEHPLAPADRECGAPPCV